MSTTPTPKPYATEKEAQDALASLAATREGMVALYQALGLEPSPDCLMPQVRTEVCHPDPEAATARLVPAGDLIAVDIETNRGWHDNGGQIVTVAVWAGDDPADHAVFGPGPEAGLLADLGSWLDRRTPATIVTWNGKAFDMPYLAARSKALGIELGTSLARHNHVDVGRLWREPARDKIGTWRLKAVAHWHGIDVIELDCSNQDWTSRHTWNQIRAYNVSDVRATHQLAVLWRAGHGRPRRTDLEVDDGRTPIAIELKQLSGNDSCQVANYDRLLPPDTLLLLVSAIPATWSTWGRIRTLSWTALATGLRSSRLPAAVTVAARLDASAAQLHVGAELTEATHATVGQLLDACDAGDIAYHESNGRLHAVSPRPSETPTSAIPAPTST